MSAAFRERCREFLNQQRRDAMLRQGSPLDDIISFVLCEMGRAVDEKLDDKIPLALYFSSVADREEFVKAVMEAKPGMIAKRWPR
jgi:hypothetical protein